MSTNPRAVWDALNERQRTYLRALYKCDQSTEAARCERMATSAQQPPRPPKDSSASDMIGITPPIHR